MTTHDEDFKERCHAYWDGALPPKDVDALLAEVTQDPKKLAWFSTLERSMKALVASMESPIPPELEARLEAAISAEVAQTESARLQAKSRPARFPWQAAVASVLLLVVAAVTLPKAWQWAVSVPGEPIGSSAPSQSEQPQFVHLSDADLEAEMISAWDTTQGLDETETQLADTLPPMF